MEYHVFVDNVIVAHAITKTYAIIFGKRLTQLHIANVTVVDNANHVVYHCD